MFSLHLTLQSYRDRLHHKVTIFPIPSRNTFANAAFLMRVEPTPPLCYHNENSKKMYKPPYGHNVTSRNSLRFNSLFHSLGKIPQEATIPLYTVHPFNGGEHVPTHVFSTFAPLHSTCISGLTFNSLHFRWISR